MADALKIAHYFTNVDLADGMTLNLAEIELALKINPGQFSSLFLLDQANGKAGIIGQRDARIYPTGWSGPGSSAKNFSQQAWTQTGIALVNPSALNSSDVENLLDRAKKDQANYIQNLEQALKHTSGVSVDGALMPIPEDSPPLGITTAFKILEEIQTGSPKGVDTLLAESQNSELLGSNPHAIILSNHGGSYLYGSNGDGPDYDIDPNKQSLHVSELETSLNTAIQSYSPSKDRFGLIGYDECLMANIETATQLATATRYFLASQEIIPGNGCDYFITLSDYKLQTPLNTQEQIEAQTRLLGLAFVSTYSQRNGEHYTLSLTDSEAIPQLNQAIRRYADAITTCEDKFLVSLLKSIRLKGSNYSFPWLQDLGTIALISRSMVGAPQALIDASNEILAKLDHAIVSNNQNYRPIEGFREQASSGLTISLPTELSHFSNGWSFQLTDYAVRAPRFEQETEWSRVIKKIEPLLQSVQTNAWHEASNARTPGAGNPSIQLKFNSTDKQVDQAFAALRVNVYLSQSSADPLINNDAYALPIFYDTTASKRLSQSGTIADLELLLDVISLRIPGHINVKIVSSDGTTKASWIQNITQPQQFAFEGIALAPEMAHQALNAEDRIIITPDDRITFGYDLLIKLAGHQLNSINPESHEWPSSAADLNSASLINISLDQGKEQIIKFQSPVLPPNSNGNPQKFYTSIALRSNAERITPLMLSITKDGEQTGENTSSETLTFLRSNEDFDESIELDANTSYTFKLTNSGTLSQDIAFMIDPFANSWRPLKDALLVQDVSLRKWGQININQELKGSMPIVALDSAQRIDSPLHLKEGQQLAATYTVTAVDRTASLQAGKSGGTQTFSSGLWWSESEIPLEIYIQGTSSRDASIGFFKVDDLTGAIQTEAGLVMPDGSEAYRTAALQNLVKPLTRLDGYQKKGLLAMHFQANQYYAAVLISEDHAGKTTALYSLAGANPNQSIQMLSFDRGYYGFEDLIKGQDIAWDGDYNDVTFYLA